MNEVNNTLFIPLYAKAKASKKGIFLNDLITEQIWEQEKVPISRMGKSKWLAYNMAMRASIFDDWTNKMLATYRDAVVLHIGSGLDNRYGRVRVPCSNWFDCDFTEVLELRKRYFIETDTYHLMPVDVTKTDEIEKLPNAERGIVIMEGISMYLSDEQLCNFFSALEKKYRELHILTDFYTSFGVEVSKHKNPVKDMGVRSIFGRDSFEKILSGTELEVKQEYTLTPNHLVKELRGLERLFFRFLFVNRLYRKIYRLYEIETAEKYSSDRAS